MTGSVTKDEYLLRNFSKISHKKWELYIVTRILHLLNDPNIEYVCQQYIKPSTNNNYYLTDLCFPSLKIYLEVNESQHAMHEHKINDKIRQREILDATDWEQKSIDVYQIDQNEKIIDRSLKEIDQEVDEFIEYIRNKKKIIEKDLGRNLEWNYEERFSPNKHIKKGYIDVSDNVVFLNHRDALRLFGYQGKHFQRAYWRLKKQNKAVWFPKLYPNGQWENSLSDNNEEIFEKQVINGVLVGHKLPEDENRIVFAHYKNILGQTVYKFYGEYKVDWTKTNTDKHVFKRVSKVIHLADYQV